MKWNGAEYVSMLLLLFLPAILQAPALVGQSVVVDLWSRQAIYRI